MKYLVVQAYWYFDTLTGEFRYRIQNPGATLNDHPEFRVINVHIFHPLFPDLALQADILILHLIPDPEIDKVLRLRKRLGKATLFEIADNFLELGPWMADDDAHRNPYIRQRFLDYARRADALQLSSEALLSVFGDLNPNTIVLENQADHFDKKDLRDDRLVIGWGGSKGHEQDLAEIAPVLKRFIERHDDAVFSYMGWPPIFQRHFSDLPRERTRLTPAGPIGAYFDFLSTLHVGLAPLADTGFNRCRSDIKFVEYAAHRVVPVLADAAPYRVHGRHGENALIFSGPAELETALMRLHGDRELLGGLADRAYRFASTRRAAINHVGRRVTFFKRFLKNEPPTTEMPDLPDCSGLIAYLRLATDSFAQGRYVEAMRKLDEVLGLHPSYGAAHIWRIETLSALGEHRAALAAYAEWQPPAIYADIFHKTLASAARRLGLEGWRRVAVQISDPVLRMETDPGLEPDQETRLRSILVHNPFHYDALVELSRICREDRPEEAASLIERARFIHPESAELTRLAAEITVG